MHCAKAKVIKLTICEWCGLEVAGDRHTHNAANHGCPNHCKSTTPTLLSSQHLDTICLAAYWLHFWHKWCLQDKQNTGVAFKHTLLFSVIQYTKVYIYSQAGWGLDDLQAWEESRISGYIYIWSYKAKCKVKQGWEESIVYVCIIHRSLCSTNTPSNCWMNLTSK